MKNNKRQVNELEEMSRKKKMQSANVILSSIMAVIFLIGVILLPIYLSYKEREKGIGSFETKAFLQPEKEFTFEEASTSITTALIYAWHALSCPYRPKMLGPTTDVASPDSCPPGPYVPYREFFDMGIRTFFIRGSEYFPINASVCADIIENKIGKEDVNWREALIECLKRHGVKEEQIPKLKPPSNILARKEGEVIKRLFSLREGDRTFEIKDEEIYPMGKIGHPGGEPFWWRALGIRITAQGLDILESSVEGYLNQVVSCASEGYPGVPGNRTRLMCLANAQCARRNGNDTCTSCCDPDGNCRNSSGSNNWCGTNQCPPGSAAPSSPCPSGISCPNFSGCGTSSYSCQAVPFGDCGANDSFMCDTNMGGCAVGANDGLCIYINPLNVEVADCPYFSTFSCSPFTSTCSDDGLIADIFTNWAGIETFTRVTNFDPNPPPYSCRICNSGQTEVKCSSDCNTNQSCSCRCCDDAQAGCGLIHWPPGCPCCDDRVRVRVQINNLSLFNLAFLIYGPTTVPFSTACGSPATSWKTGHPGEWLDLCACNQDVQFTSGGDPDFCDFGFLNICGFLTDIFVGADETRCQLNKQINNLIGTALKSALSSTLPISAMEKLGACSLSNWDIGIYPEFCAGGSLGYSYNYSTGGAGILLFADAAARITAKASCVLGTCPNFPSQVASSSCKGSPQTCFPNAPGYNVGIYVDQEFINELIHVFWSHGFLCYNFTIPWDTAKIIIPGIRQAIAIPEPVRIEVHPVCTNPTQTFSTVGSQFIFNIPAVSGNGGLKLRFITANTNTQLFDIDLGAVISGNLGFTTAGCHSADTLCSSNPTFKCWVCSGGSCSWQNIPYGPGYFTLTGITIDPQVVSISNTHPTIGTPANTDIADLLVVVLDGVIGGTAGSTQIATRMYDLFRILPIKLDAINFFGFANNAFLLRYNLNPFCMNFVLDFGNFAPPAWKLIEKGQLLAPKELLEMGEISQEEFEKLSAPRIKTQEEIETIVEPIRENGRRIRVYSESSTQLVVRSFDGGPVRFRVSSAFPKPLTEGSKVKCFWWKIPQGAIWFPVKNGELRYKALNREEEIEVFCAVEEFNEKGGPFYNIVDQTPIRIKIQNGLKGVIMGPEKIYAGQNYEFYITIEDADFKSSKVDAVSFSLDGVKFSEFIPGNKFSTSFQEAGKYKIQVIFESGEYSGYAEKEIEVIGPKGAGCGGLPGISFFIPLIIFPSMFFALKKLSNLRK